MVACHDWLQADGNHVVHDFLVEVQSSLVDWTVSVGEDATPRHRKSEGFCPELLGFEEDLGIIVIKIAGVVACTMRIRLLNTCCEDKKPLVCCITGVCTIVVNYST